MLKKKKERKIGWKILTIGLRKRKQDWKFNNCWFDKKRRLWFGPNNYPVPPETLKFPLLTTVHALNHLSTDIMISLMNRYWWGNINKATKSAYTSLSHLLKYKWEVLGSLFVMLLDILNCLTDD